MFCQETAELLVTVYFLSRVSIPTRDIDIQILSVRPSVRNVPVLDENGLTYCQVVFGCGKPQEWITDDGD